MRLLKFPISGGMLPDNKFPSSHSTSSDDSSPKLADRWPSSARQLISEDDLRHTASGCAIDAAPRAWGGVGHVPTLERRRDAGIGCPPSIAQCPCECSTCPLEHPLCAPAHRSGIDFSSVAVLPCKYFRLPA